MLTTQWGFALGESGVLSTGPWLWLKAMLWASALFALTLFFFFASLFSVQWLHLPARAAYATAVCVPVVAFLAYRVAVKYGEIRTAQEIGITRGSLYELLLGAVIGFTTISATLLLLWSVGLYNVHFGLPENVLDSFIFDSYISGMLEELAFRAILLRITARAFGPLTGLIASSVLFGAAHLSHDPWWAALQLALNGGIPMGLLYMTTGRLWMSVGMHTAWDFTEEAILGVNSKSGILLSTPVFGKAAILTGGSVGPDGSLLACVIGLALIACILYANSRDQFRYLRARNSNN